MVYINKLNGGDITIGAGGSAPAGHPETRFTLQDGTVETYNITGPLDQQWLSNNGYYIPWDDETSEGDVWLKTITQVDIGNTVTSIGEGTFTNCLNLTIVTAPDSVTSIEEGYTFNGCSNLTSVTLPGVVGTIGDEAFYGCSNLTELTISDGVTSIASSAFYDCGSLTGVTITANGGNAENVKQMMIEAGVDENITWNMPS